MRYLLEWECLSQADITMFEHSALIAAELAAHRPVALAVVTAVSGSAPRPAGSSMVITVDGRIVGGISAGCVESSVVLLAEQLFSDQPATVETFSYDDRTAFGVGLTCGGSLDVAVCLLDPESPGESLRPWFEAAAGRESMAAVVLSGPAAGQLASAVQLEVVDAAMRASHGVGNFVADDGTQLLAVHHRARPQLVIYGAVDIAADLTTIARKSGFVVTVCDPRPAFVTAERLVDADEVVRAWPVEHASNCSFDARSVACVLSHDDRFDTELLKMLLAQDMAYVGAMGSRSTHERRVQALREAGVPESHLARLHSPIGLDIGATTSFDTAISIMAEIVATKNGRVGGQLRDTAGSIHSGPARSTRITAAG